MRGFLKYNWRPVAATVILVVVGIMAISIMVKRPSFGVVNTDVQVTCPSMLSSPQGGAHDLYLYGRDVSGLASSELDEYIKARGLDNLDAHSLSLAYRSIDANLVSVCRDRKASQQGRLVATLGSGVLLLAFLAVPGRRDPLRDGS